MPQSPPEKPVAETRYGSAADLPATEADPRYSPEQMICCGKCERVNPPNRAACFYCGAELESTALDTRNAKVNFTRPEPWEDGFSLVYAGENPPLPEGVAVAAEQLQLQKERLEEILSASPALPLTYLRSLPDANMLAAGLSGQGFDCAIVGDDLLTPRIAPTRIRGLIFTGYAVVFEDFNTLKETSIDVTERVLVVTGTLARTSFEELGKVNRRVYKITDQSTAISHEKVVDIYPQADVYGFRIRASGFDFSCLGERMDPLAAKNVTEVASELRSRFSNAVFVETYDSVSRYLNDIWPVNEVKESSNVSRGPLGGVRMQRRMVADNTLQFTKFSRLQRHFI